MIADALFCVLLLQFYWCFRGVAQRGRAGLQEMRGLKRQMPNEGRGGLQSAVQDGRRRLSREY